MKSLRGAIAGVLFGASLLFPASTFAKPEKIFDRTFQVEMNLESNPKIKPKEDVRIEADYDDEKKDLYLSYFTQDYDRTNWTKEDQITPLWERYTTISAGSTQVYVVHPKTLTVKDVEENSYLVREDYNGNIIHNFSPVSSLDNHPYLQVIFDLGGKELTKLVKKVGVKYLDKALEAFEKDIENRKERVSTDLVKAINKDYKATEIPFFPLDSFWDVETARSYKMTLDTTSTKEIPISLWVKLGFGDHTPSETFTNKWGDLDGIIINFTMNKKVTKQAASSSTSGNSSSNNNAATIPQRLEDYFPSQSEIDMFGLTPSKITILNEINNILDNGNPYIYTARNIASENLEGLIEKGIAAYRVLDENREMNKMGFYIEVSTFDSEIPESIKERAYQYSDLTNFGLIAGKGKTYVCIDSFMNYKTKTSGQLAEKYQILNYLFFLEEYKKRIGATEIIMNPQDLKSLKDDFQNHPERLTGRITNLKSFGFKTLEDAINWTFSPVFQN